MIGRKVVFVALFAIAMALYSFTDAKVIKSAALEKIVGKIVNARKASMLEEAEADPFKEKVNMANAQGQQAMQQTQATLQQQQAMTQGKLQGQAAANAKTEAKNKAKADKAVSAAQAKLNAKAAALKKALANNKAASKKANAKSAVEADGKAKAAKAKADKELAKKKKDLSCGCRNGGECLRGQCECDWQWTGKFCEVKSPAMREREEEMDRVANLAKAIGAISQQVTQMEKQSGAKAISAAVEQATSKKIQEFELHKSGDDFEKYLGRRDWLSAEKIIAAINNISKQTAKDFTSRLNEARKAAGAVGVSAKGIQQMPVPSMHPDKYKHIDVTKATEIDLKKFSNAEKINRKASAIHREFTLEYGEPV